MNHGPAVKQPAVTVLDIDEPTMTGAGIDLVDMDALQLQSVSLRVRRIAVRLETVTVLYHSTNAPMRTRTSVVDGLLAYVTFGPRARGFIDGTPISPDLLLAAGPAGEGGFVVEAGYEAIAFLVRAQDIRDQLSARGREAEFRLLSGVEVLQVDAAKVPSNF